MAINTSFERILINDGVVPGDERFLRMAIRARHLFVRAFQRKLALFVIEGRWFPGGDGVAIGTIHRRIAVLELAAVNILVAPRAFRWRVMKGDDLGALGRNRPVTFETPDRAMGAKQFEFRLRMIERGGLLPGPNVVAALAPSLFLSLGREIAAVRILVA